MNKHSARLAKMAIKERRSRVVARLVDNGGAEIVKAADRLATEAAVLERSVKKRAAEHRGERPVAKAVLHAEYEQLSLKLRRLSDVARTSRTPLAVEAEGQRIVERMRELARTVWGSNPGIDFWLTSLGEIVRVRTKNSPAEIKERGQVISNHTRGRKRPCYCHVCQHVVRGEMSKDGAFIEKKRKR